MPRPSARPHMLRMSSPPTDAASYPVGAYRIRPASECVRVLIGRPKDATPAAGCRRDLAVGERSVTHGKRPLQKMHPHRMRILQPPRRAAICHQRWQTMHNRGWSVSVTCGNTGASHLFGFEDVEHYCTSSRHILRWVHFPQAAPQRGLPAVKHGSAPSALLRWPPHNRL